MGREEEIDLAELDMVLMRQDPPFDMAYITATHLLEHVHPATLVVNDPAHVRNAPEKLFVFQFPNLMPPTIITADRARIDAFRVEHGDIIVKPLYGNGGAGVFHLRPGDDNLGALTEMFFAASREPLMVQAYIDAVRSGRQAHRAHQRRGPRAPSTASRRRARPGPTCTSAPRR